MWILNEGKYNYIEQSNLKGHTHTCQSFFVMYSIHLVQKSKNTVTKWNQSVSSTVTSFSFNSSSSSSEFIKNGSSSSSSGAANISADSWEMQDTVSAAIPFCLRQCMLESLGPNTAHELTVKTIQGLIQFEGEIHLRKYSIYVPRNLQIHAISKLHCAN